jgi:hypothetical protein
MTSSRYIRLLPFLVLLSLTAFADIERTTKSCSVELKTVPRESGPVTVHATVSETDGELEAVSVSYLSRTINIPVEALRDLKHVDIKAGQSVRGTANIADPAKPQILIAFNSWDPMYLKKAYGKDIGVPVTIEFIIEHNQDVVTRYILPCLVPGIPPFVGDLDKTKSFKLHIDHGT